MRVLEGGVARELTRRVLLLPISYATLPCGCPSAVGHLITSGEPCGCDLFGVVAPPSGIYHLCMGGFALFAMQPRRARRLGLMTGYGGGEAGDPVRWRDGSRMWQLAGDRQLQISFFFSWEDLAAEAGDLESLAMPARTCITVIYRWSQETRQMAGQIIKRGVRKTA